MTGGRGRLVAPMRDRWGFWRRSIQARIVVYTVVLCAVATSAVGWFMLQEVRNGLLEHRVTAVTAEATEEIQDAQTRLSAASGTDVDASSQRTDLIEPIIERGLTRGFDVVMAGPITSSGSSIADTLSEFSPGLETSSVPASLQEHFDRVAAVSAWTYTSIRTVAASGAETSEPGIVLGTQVTLPADGSTYDLYFLFPLEDEAATLSLITRVLIAAGVALLLLVAAVAWWVGRRVVTPIRLAREIAERLAAGQLQERMRVAGEDDLARLAVSFNQMASALQTQIRQLEELSRVQRRFTSDVSHELRTPLTTVRMAGDMLYDARETFDPATARAAELLQSELDRFEGLLVDLLEISRFDAGAAALQLEDVDLVLVARRVVDGSRALAAQRPVELVVEEPGRPCPAEADVRRVERILRNLVSNAIDHAPEGDRVIVTVAGDEHSAAVTVRDHGIGLMPGEAAMVFNRFWRADPARARSTGGTGLGLAIALEDTHLHHGWLQAWGRPREGAQFRLTLPRHVGKTLRHSPLPLVPTDAGVLTSPVSAEPSDLPGAADRDDARGLA